MISIVIAPPTAPQVNVIHALSLAGIEHPLAGEVLNAVRQHGAKPVPLWRLINSLAVARQPDYRARLRCWRLRYWGALLELLRAKLLWRHGDLICSRDFAIHPKPGLRRRCYPGHSSGQAPLSSCVGASNSKTSGSNAVVTPAKTSGSGVQALETQIVGTNYKPPTSAREPKSAVPTATEISAAARSLARLRRTQPRKWTGWLHGEHCWRGRLVVLPGGEAAPLIWCGRKRILLQNIHDLPFREWLLWGARREKEVKLFRHPSAVALGRMKRGVRERKSEAKARAARLNGLRGGRPRG